MKNVSSQTICFHLISYSGMYILKVVVGLLIITLANHCSVSDHMTQLQPMAAELVN